MTLQGKMVHVGQGEHAVSNDENLTFSTILGSCVSTCLHDPVTRVGGLNHIVLPTSQSANPFDLMTQVNAMECLINALLQQGAMRKRLVAKVFGGANLIESSAGVGEKNAAFVLGFLTDEAIPITGQSLGGSKARRVRFEPFSGRAHIKLVEDRPMDKPIIPVKSAASGLELF